MTAMMISAALVMSFFLALVPHALWLLGWIIGKCFHYSLPYAPFGWTAIGLVVFCWVVLVYGFWIGRWRLTVTNVEYKDQKVPSEFDGYKIVHISDLHLSTFDDKPNELQRFVERINAEQPNLICFTGDLVTMGPEEASPYLSVLSQLKAKDGVVSVFGNHDFLIYSRAYKSAEQRETAVDSLAALEREKLGWHLLRNEHLLITRGGDTLTVIGVDNINSKEQGFRTINRGNLQQAMEETSGFKVLLTHDPSHWRGEVLRNTDVSLTLSGHTHAAQIKVLGWNPASWMFTESAGMYTEGNQSIYVNAGLGCTLPVRIGAEAEITCITLRKQ